MKKNLILLIGLICVFSLFAELMQAPKNMPEPTGQPSFKIQNNRTARTEYSVMVPPVTIRSSYYDYMPGSYCSLPLRVQDDGGVYLTYHATETLSATRRVYLTHIDLEGNIDFNSYCAINDIREGYPGIDIDPITNDPMIAWHVDFNQDTHYDIGFVIDQYHFLPGAGLLTTPFAVIDNYSLWQQGILEFEDDEFIWPQVYIVKAPTFETDGKRRIYVEGNNFASHGSAGSASENVLITWADFTTEDIEYGNFPNLEWNYVTIPELDGYNQDDPYWGRMQKGIAVTDDGKIAIFGFLSIDNDYDPDNLDELVCFYNENWGEGDWQTARTPSGFYVENPLNEDGTYWLTNSEGTPAEDVYFDHGTLCSHLNAYFDSIGRLHLVGSQILLYVDPDDPNSSFVQMYNDYVKSFIFNFETQEFQINDLYPQSANPNDQQAMLPWDLDEDGLVDEYDDNGYVSPVEGWPIWWHEYSVGFHENSFKVVGNEDDSRMIAVWQDGLKNKYFAEGGNPNYEEWDEIAEIAIAISNDNGTSWSEPLFLNANPNDVNYCSALDGIKPCYVYPGDKIEDLGNGHGKVHLMFFDDNSFGSYIQGNGQNIGGDIKYMALDIDFGQSAPPITYGDVDGDGAVMAYDASLTLQASIGMITLTPEQIIIADVDGNGAIQAFDASLILQYVVGIITIFPVEEGRGNFVAPTAKVSVSQEGNELVFSSEGNLFGFQVKANGIDFNNAKTEFLNSFTENEIAIASAKEISGEFLRIPINSKEWTMENANLEMIVNTERISPKKIAPQLSEFFGNYPNPFNPTTIFKMNCADNAKVNLNIYNVKGKLVKSLINGSFSGQQSFTWNGIDNSGNQASSGVYFYKISLDGHETTHKMLMLK